jgi:hypothetical protein
MIPILDAIIYFTLIPALGIIMFFLKILNDCKMHGYQPKKEGN